MASYFKDMASFNLGGTRYFVTFEVEIEKRKGKLTTNLQPIEEYHTFSFVGSYKDGGGQCYDEILEASLTEPLVVQKLIKELVDLWKIYHLNDLKAGCSVQNSAINAWKKQGNKYEYGAACEYLKEFGLYEYLGYKYGHSRLVEYYNLSQVDLVISQRKDITKKLDLLSLSPTYERQTR